VRYDVVFLDPPFGAAAADFVEADAQLADLLRANLLRLKQAARVVRSDALRFLAETDVRYDVVFLDPPFGAALWAPAAAALEAHDRLQADAWIYVESPRGEPPPSPANWRLHREGHAGAVHYALYRRTGSSAKL
jgi:16S rRNA (guanine966-N2)-methyltransferase